MKTRPGLPMYNPPGTPSVSPASTSPDPSIASVSDLANVPTAGVLFYGAIRTWINSDTGAYEVWRLLAGTDASGPGVQRPVDFNASTNALVWYKAGS